MDPPRTAAALIIGNELLTGKVQDTNVAPLAKELFALGISLRRVIFCTDEIEVIARDLNDLRREHDFVFTSGGVGPTHDDVTMRAIAHAFDQRLRRAPEVEALLRRYFGDGLTAHHLRMAEVPEGAELVHATDASWPAVRVANVFILPGLPKIFRYKLEVLRQVLAGGAPFISRAVGTRSDEGAIASLLEDLSHAHPEIAIGSYPRWDDGPVRVMVTFDGRDGAQIEHAVTALLEALPAEEIVDLETEIGGSG